MLRRSPWCALGLVAGVLIGSGEAPAAAADHKPPPRVLLLASAPTREYQFARSLFARAENAKRVTLQYYLQPLPGSTKPREDSTPAVPPALRRFPDHVGKPGEDRAEARPYNLDSYDVVIAFDPDWLRLSAGQRDLLSKWVEAGGGLILLAGPVNTGELAAARNRAALKSVLALYPVVPAESVDDRREATRPVRLHFPGTKEEPAFLKLEAQGKGNLAGWEDFFTGGKGARGAKELEHGFFGYYPAKEVKRGATVVATLAEPSARLPGGKEQPYLVTMRAGKGRVVYLASGELWRLRRYREAYHERLWMQLVRYAASGGS